MDSRRIEERLREHLTANAEREGIAAAYLFGSVARGTAGLGILYSENRSFFFKESGFAEQVENLLGSPVQLVTLNGAAPELIVQILHESRLTLELDRPQRIRFEVQSRNEFWDFEPFLRLYRETNGLSDPSLEDLVHRNYQARQ
jgi:hypothetical protein